MPKQLTFDDFRKNLEKSKSELLKRLEKKLKESSYNMEGRSKNIAFSRFKNISGHLRGSIAGSIGIFQGRPAAFLQAGGQYKGNDVFYAKFIEFGTFDKNNRRLITPRLFMGRSVEEEKETLLPEIRKIVTSVLVRN